jgi:HAD domain in Swiss Army Knife RNA repair proteins
MNNLFLDVDGVLNNNQWWYLHGRRQPGIDQYNASCLQDILDRTGCNLIITSSWSRFYHDGDMTLQGFQKLLWTHTIWVDPGKLYFLDRVRNGDQERAEGILAKQEQLKGKFAVVDDKDLSSYFENFFFKTDSDKGLQPKQAERIIKFLNNV